MKRSIVIIASIILVALVASACNLLPGAPAQNNTNADTPNLTLTALFNTSLNIPAPVTPIYIVVTNTPEAVIPTNTAEPVIPTNTTAPTNTPANTVPPTPADPHSGALMEAGYIDFDPDIDGSWNEWKEYTTQYTVSYVVYGANKWSGAEDLEASYAAVWDYDYLYISVKVHDDVYAQIAKGEELYEGDSIEILLDTNLSGDYYSQTLSSDDYQLGISHGNSAKSIPQQAYLWFPSGKTGLKSNVDIGFTIDENGTYRYEARIPWSVFGVTPSNGMRMGIAVSVSDNDDTTSKVQQTMVSSAVNRHLTNPMTWNIIVFHK
jgi:hypothetical protein